MHRMSKFRSIDLNLSRIKPVSLRDPNGNIDSIETESLIYSSAGQVFVLNFEMHCIYRQPLSYEGLPRLLQMLKDDTCALSRSNLNSSLQSLK